MSKQKKVNKKIIKVHKRRLSWSALVCKKSRIGLGIVACVLLVAALYAPVRNAVAGIFIAKDVTLVVTEIRTGEVVQEAAVIVDGKEYVTSDTGRIILKQLRPGTHTVTIEKPLYEPKKESLYVSALSTPRQKAIQLEAKGKLAKVVVKNKLNGFPVSGVRIKTESGSYARTNESGTATVVLQFTEQQTEAALSSNTIATKVATVRPAQDAFTNLIEVMPSGRLVYISGNAQTPQVTSIGLDGSEPKQLVAATGFEAGHDISLFRHSNQQWAVLFSRRDATVAQPRLLLISSGELVSLASDAASYQPVGWMGELFVYRAKTNTTGQFYAETEQLRAYDVSTKRTYVLYETAWEGSSSVDYAQETMGASYMLHDAVYFETSWRASYYYGSRLADKKMAVRYVDAGREVRVLKDWPAGYNASIRTVAVAPRKLICYTQLDGVKNSFWEITKDTAVESAVLTVADFTNTQYPRYVSSPNGVSALWRGAGQQAPQLFVGDSNAKSVSVFSPDQTYARYAWYTDDYVLLQKKSEIYIVGRGGVKDGIVPIRIVSDAATPL